MFHRVSYEEYQAIFSIIAFAITAIGFIAFVWQVSRMRKADVQHQAELPLEKDSMEKLHHG